MAMQFLEVLFHIRIVWSSEAESCIGDGVKMKELSSRQITYNPWHFVVEVNSADVVEMAMESE
jgi:hypothetical protein